MKIVIINGIQNPVNSKTKVVLESCIDGIKNAKPDAEIKIYDLSKTAIGFCIGCKKCGMNDGRPIGKCVQNDPMQNILEEMLAADRIVFASPLYCFSYSALVSRFAERTLPLAIYPEKNFPKRRLKKSIPDKKGLILLTSDCPPPFNWMFGMTLHPSFMLRNICHTAGCAKTKLLATGGMRTNQYFFDKCKKRAFESGQKLVK